MGHTAGDSGYAGVTMSQALLELLIQEHQRQVRPRLERLWAYYRNPLEVDPSASSGPGRFRAAQEEGLPARLTQAPLGGQGARERVVENDIGWRVHTLVEFMFGKPVVIQSLAADREQAQRIERFLRAVIEANGGVSFYQDLALLGAVYGFVDVLVNVDAADGSRLASGLDLEQAAQRVVLEVVEAPRAITVLDVQDYRRLEAYILHVRQQTHELEPEGFLARVRERVLGRAAASARRRRLIERTQVWTAQSYARFERFPDVLHRPRRLVESGVNRLGRIPLVHIQNLPQPFFYEGLSEVEPLIPLQNELNTRLSDRANRVTFQSFKMYLGKGIEQFTERPIGPGQMWATDNPEASIQEFGGDAHNPSEEAHINEIREAMDKTSGVTPVSAGVLRGKVGNLTSENALRIVLMGLLAKTEKKRVTYGAGIERLCELVLHAADVYGWLPNRPQDRRVRVEWPNPLPDSETQRLRNAEIKLRLGVPKRRVLSELGYADCAE